MAKARKRPRPMSKMYKSLLEKGEEKSKEGLAIARIHIPWFMTLSRIRTRCLNKSASNYRIYKNYGGRGIKCLITADELKRLWFRDKAYKMKRPSIDRIDNDGHYTFDNCQYLELSENSIKKRTTFRKVCIRGHKMSGKNLREYRFKDGHLHRKCFACYRIYGERYRARKRAGLVHS